MENVKKKMPLIHNITNYVTANPEEPLKAAATAVCAMGLAGEVAYKRLGRMDGNSTYRNYIIDAIYNLTEQELTEVMTDMKIDDEKDMIQAALFLNKTYNCAVLLKGGHKIMDANDLLCENGEIKWFCGKRIANTNTHGTGCTLSSAIASNLAKGDPLEISIKKAKEYVSGALSDMLNLGKGSGPINHVFSINKDIIALY